MPRGYILTRTREYGIRFHLYFSIYWRDCEWRIAQNFPIALDYAAQNAGERSSQLAVPVTQQANGHLGSLSDRAGDQQFPVHAVHDAFRNGEAKAR